MNKWDMRFLRLAEHVASWSKDPSTKTGAVIVRQDRTIVSVGFNGFPRGCSDSPELYADRPKKLARIIHCEMNAILSALEPLHGFTLYVFPFLTCDRCAVHVIQTGISRVVAPICPEPLRERWESTFALARVCYAEAGVDIEEVDL